MCEWSWVDGWLPINSERDQLSNDDDKATSDPSLKKKKPKISLSGLQLVDTSGWQIREPKGKHDETIRVIYQEEYLMIKYCDDQVPFLTFLYIY